MTPEARRRRDVRSRHGEVFEAEVYFALDGRVLGEGAWLQLVIAPQRVFGHPEKLLV
jgi:hypothetical protein